MALTQKTEVDKIEVVGKWKSIQVRVASWVEDDEGNEIGGKQYHRHVVQPGDSLVDETAEVQAIAATLHTDELIAAYQASLAGDEDVDAPAVDLVPEQITALQGMMAIDQSGLSDAFDAWANDPARTFSEKAYIQKADVWKRNDPVLAAGAEALGLTDEQVDDMFKLAKTL